MPASALTTPLAAQPDQRPHWTALIRLAVLLFVPAAVAASFLAYVLLKADVAVRLEKLKVQEAGEVRVASNLLSHNLEDAISDLRLLALSPALQHYLDTRSGGEEQRVIQHFINLSETKARYDKVRLIGRDGRERIRVNRAGGKAILVPPAQLQDKAGRYYFTETIKLKRGQIYISPLDLNVDNNRIEEPFKPELRISSPIYDSAGRLQGILILNYLGQEMLDDFTRAMGEDRHAMLLNREGYWLRHPDHSHEWAFMRGSDDTFGKAYPLAWQSISSQESGNLIDAEGLITFTTVHPLPIDHAYDIASARHYYWKIVSRVETGELPAITPRQYPRAYALYLITLLLLVALALYLANILRSRQLMSRTLQENEARLNEITSTLAEGLYVMDECGRTTYVNPEAERLLGWSADELIGQCAHDMFHHQHEDGTPLPADACEIFHVMRTGRVYHSTTQVFWRKDGSSFPVEVSASPIMRDGRHSGAVIAFSDVTRRKQDELALRNRTAQLVQAQQLAQVGSWELDLLTQKLSWSDEIYRIFEVAPAEFGANYQAFISMVHPLDRQRVEQAYAESVTGHTPYNIEHRLLLRGGRVKYVVERGETFYGDDGSPLRSFGTVQDITARKEAQEALRSSEETTRALLNANTESAILIDISGTILAINRIGAQRLRTTIDAALRQNIFTYLSPALLNSRRRLIDSVVQSGEPVRFQDERDGMHMDSSLYPIFDAGGMVRQIAIYSVDITERIRLEAEELLLQHIDQQALRSPSLSALLQFIAHEIVASFHYPLVWLGRKESDGRVSISALAGDSNAYANELQEIGVRWDDTPLGQGPAGSAIREGTSVVSHVSDAALQPWSDAAARYGIKAIAAFPLSVRNDIYGALVLYCQREEEFDDPATLQHLAAVTGRICVAVEMAMDQQQLRLLSSALASASNATFITDPDGRIQWINNAFTRLTGYSEQEAIGHTPALLKSGKQDAPYYQKLWKTIQKGKTWSSETVERHKTGMLFTVQQTITPLFNENGQVSHFISILDDISAQKEIAARIQYMAHFDALTTLPNRVLFYDRLRQVLSQARRDGHYTALMFLDLDRFKAVNDTLGHHIGDLLLQESAQRIKSCVRESDTVARLAGDEFTVLLPNVHTSKDISAIAEKIIAALSEPFLLDNQEASIGCSIGIAIAPTDADTDDALIRCADKAMYAAKEQGRGKYHFYAPTWP